MFDTDDNPITGFNFAIDSGAVITFQVRDNCQDGLRLYSETVGDLTVEGRIAGGGSFTDLEGSYIDLTPYAGTRQTFDIRITAGSVSTPTRRKFRLRVGP